MKTFKWGILVCVAASLCACANTQEPVAKVEENAISVPAVAENVEKTSDQTDCAEINFPQNLQYLNQVKCMSYPVRSEDVLDANTKKLKNGQYDLREIKEIDENNFFEGNHELQEKMRVVAKYALNNEVTTFILMNNLSMEGEGFAQTYNFISVNNNSGKIINERFYYVDFDRRQYDDEFDFQHNENTSYFLQDKPEIGKCTIHFEVSYPNFLKRTRTCWDKKGNIEQGPVDRIYDIKYENDQIEYKERCRC